jgi:hypothetical protein
VKEVHAEATVKFVVRDKTSSCMTAGTYPEKAMEHTAVQLNFVFDIELSPQERERGS